MGFIVDEIFEVDERTGHIKLVRTVDNRPECFLNKLERGEIGHGFTRRKTMRKIADIPLAAILAEPPEVQERILSDDNELRKWLKAHPEYLVSEGKL